jgi:hypothetical protein
MIANRAAPLLDTRVPESSCPNCGKPLDAVMSTEGDHKPSPGDMTICTDCRHLCAFAEDMSLRELTDDEVVVVAGDKRVLRAMKALGDLERWKERR